jgi:hypothetical protein
MSGSRRRRSFAAGKLSSGVGSDGQLSSKKKRPASAKPYQPPAQGRSNTMVEPLRSKTMTLNELQLATLDLIRKVRFQMNRLPYQDGMSDFEFLENVVEPLEQKIYADRHVAKMHKKARAGQERGDEASTALESQLAAAQGEVERWKRLHDLEAKCSGVVSYQLDRIREHFDKDGDLLGEGRWRLTEILACVKVMIAADDEANRAMNEIEDGESAARDGQERVE